MLYKLDEALMKPHSRYRIPYYSAKEMRVLYPNENFTVIGEIGSFARPPTDGDKFVTEDGQLLPVLPRGSLKKPFDRVAGYVPVRRDTYLALVKSLLPAFCGGGIPFGRDAQLE